MQTTKIYRLKDLPENTFHQIMDGLVESARLWNFCVDMHKQARQNKTPWPTLKTFQEATKGGKFALYSQSVQQVFRSLLGAVGSTKTKRAAGDKAANYPHKEKYFYPLIWPSQNIHVEWPPETAPEEKENGSKEDQPKHPRLILPMGRNRPSLKFRIKDLPKNIGSVKIVWSHGLELHVTTETDEKERTAESPSPTRACVDLGEIHLAAVVTNKGDALVVTGRGIRSHKRLYNLSSREISKLQSRCKKGSRRWKKLAAARRRLNGRTKRRVRDARHKATRAVVNFCVERGVETLFVGNPDGVRKKPKGRKFNQKLAQWEYGEDKKYIQEKAARAAISCFTGSERYTSSTCPVCGRRRRPKGRRWKCSEKTGGCGFSGHRDVVGAVNMHAFTFKERIPFPEDSRITYLRPATDSRRRVSRGGEQ